jgi:hypothetical protein
VLPDFPSIKLKLRRRLTQRFEQQRNSGLGIFGQLPAIVLPEGDRLVFQREDGTERETEFKPFVVEVNIPRDELLSLDPSQMIEKFDRAAREMAQKQHIQAFEELNRAVSEVGNTVDGAGQPFGPAQILQSLEKILVDFDERGKPELPTMVIHPDMAAPVQGAFKRLEEDPSLLADGPTSWKRNTRNGVLELEVNKIETIHVCTVCPTSTDTPFFEHAANYSGHEFVPTPPVYEPEDTPASTVCTNYDIGGRESWRCNQNSRASSGTG